MIQNVVHSNSAVEFMIQVYEDLHLSGFLCWYPIHFILPLVTIFTSCLLQDLSPFFNTVYRCCGSVLSLVFNFTSLCFKLIIIYYHAPKQREIKFKPKIKLNHNIDKRCHVLMSCFVQACSNPILSVKLIYCSEN